MVKDKFEIEFLNEAREFLKTIEDKARYKLINSEIMEKKLKKYSLDEIKDEFVGKKGTTEREQYEYDLQMDVLGELIKQTRIERKLTQEQLGDLIGVQKAQISRLENHTGNVTLSTILKVFSALKAKIKMQVELEGNSIQIA